MTFGEHLEELRSCLFKAACGLAIGFIIGLLVGRQVVQFIQRPLLHALANFCDRESIDRFRTEIEKVTEQGGGQVLPWTLDQVKDRVVNRGLLFEDVYIDPVEMLPELNKAFPEQFRNVQLPPRTESTDDGLTGLIHVHLWRPSKEDPRMQIKSFNAQESFGVYVKASLLVGVLLTSPWIFYQIWSFVAAGLYPHERRYVQMYLPFSIGLFLAGAALAFFVVFEPVLNFLFSFNRMTGIAPEPRITEWLGFVLLLPVGFGIGFQLPLVMLFLERIGVFTVKSYLKQWRIAVLVIFVVAALLTPPDPYSMMLMACPLTFLYFGGILLCKLLPRHKSPYEMTTTG